jgi:hypothetical protein
MATKLIGVFVLLVLQISMIFAIGPAPITISGFMDGAETVRFISRNSNGDMNVFNDAKIISFDDIKYYLKTITVDSTDTIDLSVEFLHDGEVVYKEELRNVVAWQQISLNFSFVDDEPGVMQSNEVNLPNTVENEMLLLKTEEQIDAGNISFIKEFNNSEINQLIREAVLSEQPVMLEESGHNIGRLTGVAMIVFLLIVVLILVYVKWH